MKKIFVISWFYPPNNSSEGLVTYKLLNNSRYEYDVFAQNRRDDWSFGMNMDFPNRDNVHSFFAEGKEMDEWMDEAFEFFKAHRDEYDCVMTRSMPPESHVVGLRIKKAYPEVKWIASFGDPIKDFPYQHINCTLYSYHSMSNKVNQKKGWRFKLNPVRILKALVWRVRHRAAVKERKRLARLEEDTIAAADKLIFNNRSQLRYMARTPEAQQKAVLVHHSYDEALYKEVPHWDPKAKTRFIFLGQLNELRTGMPLLKAIKSLQDSTGDLAERAEFVFYGDMGDDDLAYIYRNHLESLIHFEDPIPYSESLVQASRADWVIHIDANIASVVEDNVFFAGKIADYFGAGSQILSVSMPKGDVVDELRRAGMMTLSFSPGEIKQYLYLILYRGYQIHPDWDYIRSSYSAPAVAAGFDDEAVKPLIGR